jgi:SAM-dependent methyltransferase
MMRDMEIDIAVDLGGYTSDTRTDIFAYRPAPVQVSYLGYPGTLGTDYMDYIIADRFVIPEDQHAFYSEQVAYLPDCYLPTDASIEISKHTPSRVECGLPETGFIFCSFNHDYKISPAMFDVWMRLLQQVPGSVLWLMSRSEVSQAHLRCEAEIRGVAPERLIFAQRVPLVEDHLARYRQADLFLDTYPYNAHTTAADALMAGLPVLTCSGNAFPSRVAGSLLMTIGLPELVTNSFAEYEATALSLARQAKLLLDFKQRLAANQKTSALFDTSRFCRSLEALFVQMSQGHLIDDEPSLLSDSALSLAPMSDNLTSTLDLGCGTHPRNPFSAQVICGVDVREDLEAGIKCADLAIEPIPFGDESFDYVTAYDFIEHIPRVIYVPQRRNAFVELMNEVHRVLKTGGLFLSLTPAYPHAEAFQDPTHVNIITDKTFPAYFDHVNRWGAGYGFKGAFIVCLQEWRGPHLLTVLKKIEWPQIDI